MKITASRLREDVYRLLDRVLETGVPLEVVRQGRILRIVPESKPVRRSSRKKHTRVMIGDPEEFVHVEWLHAWSEWK